MIDPWALSRTYWKTIDAWLEPAVRAGFATPSVLPVGLVVLETRGARTGRLQRVLLTASVVEGCLFVGTLLGSRSGWLANLRADPRVRYWLSGQERQGRALLFSARAPWTATQGLPGLARSLADGLLPVAVASGWRFAVIT